MLRLGGPKNLENLGSGSPRQTSTPRRALLRLGIGVSSKMQKWPDFALFTKNGLEGLGFLPNQNQLNQNSN